MANGTTAPFFRPDDFDTDSLVGLEDDVSDDQRSVAPESGSTAPEEVGAIRGSPGHMVFESGVNLTPVPGLPGSPAAARVGLETAGDVGGTAVGTALGGPAGARVGGPVGAAAGSLASELFDPSGSPGKRAATAAAATAAVPPLVKAGGKILKGGSRLVPGGEEFIRSTLEAGRRTTAGIVTKGTDLLGRAVDVLEDLFGSSFGGSGIILAAREEGEDVATAAAREAVENLSRGGREDVGELVSDIIDERVVAHRAAAVEMAEELARAKDGVSVDISGAFTKAREIIDKSTRLSEDQRRVAQAVIEEVEAHGTTVIPFERAQVLRSDLIGVGTTGTELIKGKAKGAGKVLSGLVDNAMEAAASARGFVDDWRAFNEFWKKGAERFNSRLFRRLASSEPEAVFEAAVKRNRPGSIRKLRETIFHIDDSLTGEARREARRQAEDAWSSIQGQFLSDLWSNATETGGEVTGRKLLNGFNRLGDDALRQLFPDSNARQNLRTLFRNVELSQAKKAGEKTPGIVMQFAQAGAAGGILLGGGDLGDASLVFIGPAVAARLMTTKPFVRWASIGLRAPAGSREAAEALGKLTALVAKETALRESFNPEPQERANAPANP